MKKLTLLFLTIILTFFIPATSWAFKSNIEQVASTTVQLQSTSTQIRASQNWWVVLRMQMEPGWHVYWQNPGDSGLAHTIEWTLPEGFEVGHTQWPVPERVKEGSLTTYGYYDDILFLHLIKAPDELTQESYTATANVKWLICREVCVPAEATLTLTINTTDGDLQVNEEIDNAIRGIGDRWPRPWEGDGVSAYAWQDQIILDVSKNVPQGSVDFFPYNGQLVDHGADQAITQGSNLWRMTINKSPEYDEGLTRVKGVLSAHNSWEQGPLALIIDVPLQQRRPPAIMGSITTINTMAEPSPEVKRTLTIWLALLFAFIGGLILNLMPCVLPVLSIKVITLIKYARDRQQAWQGGLMFTLGILVTFWALAGLLIILRLMGMQIGWGFQFQSPEFLMFMAALLFLIGLNLMGVFEVGTSFTAYASGQRPKHQNATAFNSGVLTTLVATPCTAPFMGSALGYALTQPFYIALLVFTALGLGMAFPYLLLCRFPEWLKFVPKPGQWMNVFKGILGFIMMAVVVWFAYVLSFQTGAQGMLTLLVILWLSALAAWLFGQKKKVLALMLILGAIAVGYFNTPIAKEIKERSPVTSKSAEHITWHEFRPGIVEELRSQGKTVFLDFTAAWCLTCQVNERVAFSDQKVINAFHDLDIVAIKADWTNYDENITRALAAFGKSSIPFYVLYPSDQRKSAIILPEVLTPDIVLKALDEL